MTRLAPDFDVDAHQAKVASWRRPAPSRVDYVPIREKRKAAARCMNGLETAFSLLLEARKQRGEIEWWAYEPMRIRLADGTYYRPDFATSAGGKLEFWETKGGFMREAARVRLNVAAGILPFPFYLVRRNGRGFDIRQIGQS